MEHSPIGAAAVMRCQGLVARYSRVTVVFGVDLDVASGEMLVVLGANGAGKSSALGAIAGIVSSSGQIKMRGREVGRMSAHRRAKAGLSFVPERRGNIFPTMSVRENIDIGLSLLPAVDRDEQRTFILDLFPSLARRETVMAGVLSGGEQQMLAIGLALGRRRCSMSSLTHLMSSRQRGLACLWLNRMCRSRHVSQIVTLSCRMVRSSGQAEGTISITRTIWRMRS
jgi:branched-chain amino acid transport system ATP-binding protein